MRQWCSALGRAGRWLARGGRGLAGITMLGVVLLSGCASTITSEVTAFRQPGWQNDPPRTYAFERSKEQQAQLDRDTYEAWVADALSRYGFERVARPQARYLVTLDYEADPRLVRVQETYYPDPWYPGPYWGPYWGPYGYYRPWGPWGWPGYWPPHTVIRDVPATLSSLRIYIREAATDKRVYQVTAQNFSEGGTLPAVMPYLVRSAFAEFPMDSGRPRRVTLEVDKPGR